MRGWGGGGGIRVEELCSAVFFLIIQLVVLSSSIIYVFGQKANPLRIFNSFLTECRRATLMSYYL